MQTKLTVLALVGVGVIIGGVLLFLDDTKSTTVRDVPKLERAQATASVGNAVMEDGVQYVDIVARGGYTPKVTKAHAGVPTVLRMKTENTFDCSLALVIPDLGFQEYLDRAGVKEIEVPADKAQGTLRGMCSMAMYHFQIDFVE
jgi:plastocyanin domain-containing protein